MAARSGHSHSLHRDGGDGEDDLRDLQIYKQAGISQIHQRIGLEIPRRKLQLELKQLVTEGKIGRRGSRRYTMYLWTV